MRAVTWTQVAQYIILIVAYLIPVVWLSVKQTGVPMPQAVYGYQLREGHQARATSCARIRRSSRCASIFKARAAAFDAKLKNVPAALAADKAAAEKKVADLKAANAPGRRGRRRREGAGRGAGERGRRARRPGPRRKTANDRPASAAGRHAATMRRSSPAIPTATPAAQKTYNESRRNFLALVFCLMVGTAALPHILMRYYTTPSVKQARESVTWSLFFIFLLYFTAPALAVLVKYEVFNVLVGTPFDAAAGMDRELGGGRPDAAVA